MVIKNDSDKMDTLDVLISALGLILAVLLALIPYFRKTYFVGPELTIELTPHGGFSRQRGLSNNNDFSKGSVEQDTAVIIWENKWDFRLKITNNSNITAYYPELIFASNNIGFTTLETLEKNIPIKGDEQKVLKATYVMFEECMGKNRTQRRGMPKQLNDLEIILKYKNPSKTTFYTIFQNSKPGDKNTYTRKTPKKL
jgi:hypothetical protein